MVDPSVAFYSKLYEFTRGFLPSNPDPTFPSFSIPRSAFVRDPRLFAEHRAVPNAGALVAAARRRQRGGTKAAADARESCGSAGGAVEKLLG